MSIGNNFFVKLVKGGLLVLLLGSVLASAGWAEPSSVLAGVRLSDGTTRPEADSVNFTAYYNGDDSKIQTEDSWNDENLNTGYVASSGYARVNPAQTAGDQSSQTFNTWISYSGTGGNQGGTAAHAGLPSSGTAYATPNPVSLNASNYLAAPTGAAAYAGNGETFIKWNQVAGATGYRVYRRPADGEGPTEIVFSRAGFVASGSQLGLVDSGRTNGTAYNYIVVATDATRRSAHTAEIAVTPSAVSIAVTGPASGTVGQPITITGSNFGASNTVYINGYLQTATWNGSSAITINSSTPLGAGKLVVVRNDNNTEDSIDFTVSGPNTPPVANNVNASTTKNTAVQITLNATDADGDTLTYSIVSNPSHGTLGAISGNKVTYTPANNYTGSDSFTYKANDGKVDSNTATVNITISENPNNAPVANNVNSSTTKNTAVQITLNATDADGDTLTYSIVSDSSHGTLGAISGNKVTYTPANNYTGSDSFTYKANDGKADSNTATVNITISDVPPPDPIISGILPATAEVGQTIVISGSNFGATKETSTVTVGGVAANPTAWSASSITVAVPNMTVTTQTTADVVVTVSGKTDSSPITVDGSKIMIDDFEGGSVGVWGATQGLADSGYYAFGAGVTPDNNNITASGPQAEAVKEGAKGMKVQYSFTSGWGGGWGATLANQLDLTSAKYVSIYVNWDGSTNAIKLSLLDNDGTSYAITIPNATLAALSGYAKVTLDKASFSYDMDGSASGSNTTFDWTKVSKYNFVYNTSGTTANYQYIDSLTASATNEVPPPPTGEAPVINSVSPSAAAGGSQITVTGLRFGSTQDNSRLDFTNLSTNVTYHANIIRWSDTTIEANVPLAPIGDYTIKVIQIRGGSGPVTALESNPASFLVTFNPTPGIATISPNPFNAGKESVSINVASSVGGATIDNIGYYIFDMTAQLVHKEVTSSTQTTWNGLDQNNAVVGDGAYILRVINEDSKSLIAKGKILVIKR